MILSILLLVCAGLCSVIVGVAVGHVERRGYSLVRYQLLNCAVCVAVAVAGWAAAPSAMFPPSGCQPATWTLVLAGTLLCGVFQYLMILMMGRAMKRGPNAIVWAIIQSGQAESVSPERFAPFPSTPDFCWRHWRTSPSNGCRECGWCRPGAGKSGISPSGRG